MTFRDQFLSKETNFHIVRHIAAIGVILNHSYILFSGNKLEQPLRSIYGISLGEIALDFFLFVSGYFVTLSMQSRDHVGKFLAIRSARLQPALVMSLLFGCFVLVPLFGGLDFEQVISKGTLLYMANNTLMFPGMWFNIPGGAFMDNPFRGSINGAIWTLTVEARLILGLAAAWWILRKFKNRERVLAYLALIGGIGCLSVSTWLRWNGEYVHPAWRLYWMFLLGAWIRLTSIQIPKITNLHIAIIGLLGVAGSLLGPDRFPYVWPFYSPWFISVLCFVPVGRIRKLPRDIDYSYGLFVYAFPVQQSIVALGISHSPLQLFAMSLSIAFLLASLSWHFVEKPIAKRVKAWVG